LAKAHFLGITLNATGNTKAVLFKAACLNLEVISVWASFWQNHIFWELLLNATGNTKAVLFLKLLALAWK